MVMDQPVVVKIMFRLRLPALIAFILRLRLGNQILKTVHRLNS